MMFMIFIFYFYFFYIDYFLSKDLSCKCAHIFHKSAHWEIGEGFSNWGHFNLQTSKKLDKLENQGIYSLEINIM
jgi:hypothetical protein